MKILGKLTILMSLLICGLTLSACDVTTGLSIPSFIQTASSASADVSLNTAYDVEVAAATMRRLGLAAMEARQCKRSEASAPIRNACVPHIAKVEIRRVDAALIVALNSFRATVDSDRSISFADAAAGVIGAIRAYKATLYLNNIPGG